MTRLTPSLASLTLGALLLCAATSPALAGSSASSASSEGSSASFGSLSTSVEKSSNSSSGDKKVAAGDYRIIDMAEAAARPGVMRLRLQAAGGPSDEFFLFVPQEAVADGRLAAGQLVTARERSYGLEFARTETRQPFFLVLKDEWYQELQTRAVTL